MTSDRQAFLDAIRLAPEDDAPRRVYADWLDEHGEADRAALIRYQVALGPAESADFRPAELATARKVGLDLTGLMSANASGEIAWSHVGGFDRGFVSSIRNPPPASVEAMCRLLAEEPITRARLAEPRNAPLPPFVKWAAPLLGPIRAVEAEGPMLTRYAEWGPMLGCRELAVHPFNVWVPAGLRLPNGERLNSRRSTADEMRALADACGVPLRSLEMAHHIPMAGVTRPPDPAGDRLERLALHGVRAASLEQTLGQYAGSPVRELGLFELYGVVAGTVVPIDLGVVADWPGAGRLERLALRAVSYTPLDAPVLGRVAAATPNLRRLDLSAGLSGDLPPSAADGWPALETLMLRTNFGPWVLPLVERLAPRLTRLGLAFAGTADPDQYLDLLNVVGRTATRLRELRLAWLPKDGCARLAAAPALAGLEVLDARAAVERAKQSADVSAKHLDQLADAPFARNLRALALRPLRSRRSHDRAIKLFGPRCDAYWREGP